MVSLPTSIKTPEIRDQRISKALKGQWCFIVLHNFGNIPGVLGYETVANELHSGGSSMRWLPKAIFW